MLSRLDLRAPGDDRRPIGARLDAAFAALAAGASRRPPQTGGAPDVAAGDTKGSEARNDEGGDGRLRAVRAIIADVRARGDDALRDLTERFDGFRPDELTLAPSELTRARDDLNAELRTALERAARRIREYHEAQRDAQGEVVYRRDGITVTERTVPVDRAGLYVPGGRAAYPSTVLMTALPAHVAGVRDVELCVPAARDGRVPAVTLAAAAVAGVERVHPIGGAQAVAAMAYGTASIRAVDVVVGPGNAYVSLAKREVAGVVGIDGFAGPSELVVIADEFADPDAVARDLMAQAEHGPDGAAVLVTWSQSVADAVDAALERLVAAEARSAEIRSTIASGGRSVLVSGRDSALDVSNAIAPEHLELMVQDPDALLIGVRNAGAVFCGSWSPAVLGDYIAGANHVLPTAGTARFASALRVDTFLKHQHVVTATENGLRGVMADVAMLARAEGLDAHAAAVERRARS